MFPSNQFQNLLERGVVACNQEIGVQRPDCRS
jgi:hypothetical protein